MPKPKRPPRDYDADLRFAPAPENATREELFDRAHLLVKAVASGAGQREKKTKSKSA